MVRFQKSNGKRDVAGRELSAVVPAHPFSELECKLSAVGADRPACCGFGSRSKLYERSPSVTLAETSIEGSAELVSATSVGGSGSTNIVRVPPRRGTKSAFLLALRERIGTAKLIVAAKLPVRKVLRLWFGWCHRIDF